MFRVRKRVSIDCSEGGMTHQSFRDECDIRNIMKKYKKTGIVSHVSSLQPMYGDFSDPLDYRESLNAVIEAQESFDSLPAELRKRFNNDPGSLLEFVYNPENKDEAIRLGIFEAPQVPDSSKTAPQEQPTSSPT